MSKENYEAMLPEIKAMLDADTKTPNLPIDRFLQEAADLEIWSQGDRQALTAVGVAQATFDALPVRTGALRYAQSIWIKNRHSRQEARQEWDAQKAAALDLKDELKQAFRFAFRLRPELLSKIKGIEKGRSSEDLVQDLSDLSVLGNANQSLLEAITFDVEKLNTAATMSRELSNLLAVKNSTVATNIPRATRDKAYTLLKQTVDEIRQAGKYVFREDPLRLQGYYSARWTNR